MTKNKSIVKKVGSLPGKTLAIFGGVHGNEKVGVKALDKLVKELDVKRGTVFLVYANPPAIRANKRMLVKNLNRLFYKNNKGNSYEDIRARKLMKLLDGCDALLDLHSYNSETGDQFAIAETKGWKVVEKMNFPVVLEGFSKLGHGTDGYMNKQGKVGICLECGITKEAKRFLPLAIKSAYQFLQYFQSIDPIVREDNSKQKFLKAGRIVYKNDKNFRFVKNFKDFDQLFAGKPFAFDGLSPIIANKNEYIVFPRPKAKVGEEVCIVLLKK